MKVILCDECKAGFSLNSVDIEKANVIVNGQELVLVYFACPGCEKIYRIMLRDDEYYKLNTDLEITKTRMRKAYDSGNEELARVLNEMVMKKHARLSSHIDKVNKRFPGTFTFVTSENKHKDKIIEYLP